METVTERNFFEVTWGKGYPPTEKRGISLEDLVFSNEWELDNAFIQRLKAMDVGEKLKYSDLSGDVFFEKMVLEYNPARKNQTWYAIEMADGHVCQRPATDLVEVVKQVNKLMRAVPYYEDDLVSIKKMGTKENNDA
jgi:hypothetical protein